MKIHLLLFAGLLAVSTTSVGQTTDLLDNPLPQTKEEFTASEPRVINTVNFLEITPIGKKDDPWHIQAALLIAWVTNSPEVTVTIDDKVIPFAKKNPELLIIFMGGYIRYVLQNAYSKDAVQTNLAGIRSAIKAYKMGNGLRKDKNMDKLVALDESGGLENWVKERLGAH